MGNPTVYRGQKLDYNRLQQIQSKMPENTHLTNSVTKQLYTRKTDYRKHNVSKMGYFSRSSAANAKGKIRGALVKYIGRKAADQVLNDCQVHRYRQSVWQGRRFLCPDGHVVSKSKLETILQKAAEKKVDVGTAKINQNLTSLKRAKNVLSSGVINVVKDAELGPLFEAFTIQEHSQHNLNFFKLGQQLDILHEEYAQLSGEHGPSSQKAEAKRQEIARVTETMVGLVNRDNTLNVSTGHKTKLQNAVAGRSIADMPIEDLRSLLHGSGSASNGPLGNAWKKVHSLLNNTLSYFEREFSSHDQSMTQLKALRDNMNDNQHLRHDGRDLHTRKNHRQGPRRLTGFLFRRNHSKPHSWGGRRSKKFLAAKQSVQRTITAALGGDAESAKQIMKPFLDSSRALTKTDLTKIIAATDRLKAVRTQVDAHVRNGQTNVPQASDLAKDPQDVWTDTFNNFCETKGNQSFDAAINATRLQQLMRYADNELVPWSEPKQLAKTMLQQKNLPESLRSSLEDVGKGGLSQSDMSKILGELELYRRDLTQAGSDVAKLHDEFQSLVNQTVSELPVDDLAIDEEEPNQDPVPQFAQQSVRSTSIDDDIFVPTQEELDGALDEPPEESVKLHSGINS